MKINNSIFMFTLWDKGDESMFEDLGNSIGSEKRMYCHFKFLTNKFPIHLEELNNKTIYSWGLIIINSIKGFKDFFIEDRENEAIFKFRWNLNIHGEVIKRHNRVI